MSARKIVTVVGATGAQGGSVVRTLLQDKQYQVRALTRSTNTDAARALAALGAEVVQADADNLESLIAAFTGSYAVFAVTNFFEPFIRFGTDAHKAMPVEVAQGINLAKAAQATPTLEHYIWSTLPDATKISNGEYLVPHFEAKNAIDRYIRSQPDLLAKTTFFWITFYASNLYFPMFTPYPIPSGEKYVMFQSTPADTKVLSIGDEKINVGLITEGILAHPEQTRAGTIVHGFAERTTAGELLKTWGKAQNKNVLYVQVDRDTFNGLWPGWSQEMGVMMEFWAAVGDRSWSAEGNKIVTAEDLGVQNLVKLEKAFESISF